MQRQKEQLQQVVANSERQLVEANRRLAWTQTQGEKRIAAEYLVEQIRACHQERQQFIAEIQSLSQQLADGNLANEKIMNECKVFLQAREPPLGSVFGAVDENATAVYNT